MVANIGSNFGGNSLMDMVGLDSNTRIASLQRQIIDLQKQIRTLQKKLMNETDPGIRIALSRELDEISQMVVTLQQQIELIETSEQRKKSLQHQVDPVTAQEADHKPA